MIPSNYKANIDRNELINVIVNAVDEALRAGIDTYNGFYEVVEKVIEDNEDQGD